MGGALCDFKGARKQRRFSMLSGCESGPYRRVLRSNQMTGYLQMSKEGTMVKSETGNADVGPVLWDQFLGYQQN